MIPSQGIDGGSIPLTRFRIRLSDRILTFCGTAPYPAHQFERRESVTLTREARSVLFCQKEDSKVEKSKQLVVFGMGKNMITLVKVEQVKEFAAHLLEKLKSIKSILKMVT